MPIADIGNGELHYEIHGEGPPLMLVAGLGGTADYWNAQIEAFAKDYMVVVHDHRGTGQSTHSEIDYSVDQMTEDLSRLMDFLNIDRAHIVGHSTGAAMAIVLAVKAPERLSSAVIYAGWTKADPQMSRCFDVRRALLRDSGVQAYARATPLFLFPPWFIRDHGQAMIEHEPNAVAALPSAMIMESRMDAVLAFDCTDYIGAVGVPSLVICAEDDFLTPAYFSRELVELIPGAELNIIENGGHAVSVTRPELFNEAVLAFLDRQALPS
ncbi:MAG: pyrimidine utilization protein D [Alphaproteobacteria bacterium]|nr:pyrimidine utilization protein D [Alphaproteobacteria bacterium]|tara:strand:- start:285 stop:1088 length:804 start_codon:yes stop_codon:yes gene_type:complete